MFRKLLFRSRRKGHKRKQKDVPRDRRSDFGEVRRFNIPRLALAERLGQSIVRRVSEPPGKQPHVWFRRKARERLPILGLRSQRKLEEDRGEKFSFVQSVMRDSLRAIPGVRSVCRKREERRRELFRKGIAGKGRRKSPGKGGTYRRTVESETSCQVRVR